MYKICVLLLAFTVGVYSTGKRNAVYYANWDVGRNFSPDQLPVTLLTHAFYAFASVSETGEVSFSDPIRDIGNGSRPDHLAGSIEKFLLLKHDNRNLKLMLSIGGYNAEGNNFSAVAATESKRKTFVNTSIALLQNYGFDGLDIDWEWPVTTSGIDPYVSSVLLLKELRESLNLYGQTLSPTYDFSLTAAGPGSPEIAFNMNITGMDLYLDFWNLLTYDFTGPWSSVAGYHSNVFNDTSNPLSTPFSSEGTVNMFKFLRVDTQKLLLGIPLYGRSFLNTAGAGAIFSGVGSGTWDADTGNQTGVYDLDKLPLPGAIEYNLLNITASFSYDPAKWQFVSYDTYTVMIWKAEWMCSQKLGGAVFWESSGDYVDKRSLIQGMGHFINNYTALEVRSNQLVYPKSPFTNVQRIGAGATSTVTSFETEATKSVLSFGSSSALSAPGSVSTTGVVASLSITVSTDSTACSCRPPSTTSSQMATCYTKFC